jgi:3'-phosphoadenosine 5'-phosphosulfate (PAPS) 3'-phosphatase
MINLIELVSCCIDLAIKGGAIAKSVQSSGNLQIQHKDDSGTNPLTVADLQIQALITGSLLNRWPTLTLIGEEDQEPNMDAEPADITLLDYRKYEPKIVAIESVKLYIDPLDATNEFTKGNYKSVMMLIGIVVDAKPFAGVMFQPWGKENEEGILFWGIVGYGHHGLGDGLSGRPFEERVVTVTTKLDLSLNLALEKINAPKVLKANGTGYKLLLVLSGDADFYLCPTAVNHKWDICAPHAILTCFGGILSDFQGNKIDYSEMETLNKNGIIASNSLANHDRLLQLLK